MFDIRGLLTSLGFFGVLYCLLSMAVVCVWRCAYLLRGMPTRGFAHFLFGLRMFPLVVSAVVTVALAIPAFLLLESGVVDEDLGTLVFSVCALCLLAAGWFRVMTARARTARVVAEWMEGAKTLDAGAPVPTYQARPGIPLLLLFGVRRPKVLVSETTVALLSKEELRVSVRHEVGHMRSLDNLKKLMIYCCPFPGMAGLERAWQEAAELAADDAAISSRHEAVELASALVKLSELAPVRAAPAFTTGLADVSMSVRLRVERLLAWNETKARGVRSYGWYLLPLTLATAWWVAANYSEALSLTHQLTEWFVR
jgi:Zn-dependent protease with chaperone function